MIIISQDKTQFINFDNIIRVYIHKCPNEIPDIRCSTVNELEISLGDYKTLKRAKEVLQEIVKEYSSYLKLEGGPAVLQGQMDIQPNIFNIPKVYEIPEK